MKPISGTSPERKDGAQMVEPSVLRNLEDAGCSCDVVNRFCELEAQPRPEAVIRQDQMMLLNAQRRELLEELHRCQRRLDCLDYLLSQMRKQQRETGA